MERQLASQEYIRQIFEDRGSYANEVSVLRKMRPHGDRFVCCWELESDPELRSRSGRSMSYLAGLGILERALMPARRYGLRFDGGVNAYRIKGAVHDIIAKYVNDEVLK